MYSYLIHQSMPGYVFSKGLNGDPLLYSLCRGPIEIRDVMGNDNYMAIILGLRTGCALLHINKLTNKVGTFLYDRSNVLYTTFSPDNQRHPPYRDYGLGKIQELPKRYRATKLIRWLDEFCACSTRIGHKRYAPPECL